RQPAAIEDVCALASNRLQGACKVGLYEQIARFEWAAVLQEHLHGARISPQQVECGRMILRGEMRHCVTFLRGLDGIRQKRAVALRAIPLQSQIESGDR